MTKIPTALIEFKGKHRVRFESVVEYNDKGYPASVVFAEIHEDMRQDFVIRMQITLGDVWEIIEGAKEIIGISDALPSSPDIQKRLGIYKKYTQSGNTKSSFYFGVAKGGAILYYLNFTQNKRTLNISMSPTALNALILRMTHFIKQAESAFYAYYAKAMVNKKGRSHETE